MAIRGEHSDIVDILLNNPACADESYINASTISGYENGDEEEQLFIDIFFIFVELLPCIQQQGGDY